MTTTTAPIRTYESFLDAASRSVSRSVSCAWFTPEAVARRAFEQQSCVWHACWSLSMEHLAETGYGTCDLCGGVTAPNQNGRHATCTARADRGMPTPQLDASPTCSCATCMPNVRL